MTAPKKRGFKKRPTRSSAAKSPSSTKPNLRSEKYENNLILKEIRVVLQDIRFSPLIPKHQRHLLFKEESEEIKICTNKEVLQNLKTSDKEPTTEKSCSHINNAEKKNTNTGHDLAEGKKRAHIALSKEKETVISNKLFSSPVCKRSRKSEIRRGKISNSTSQAPVTTNNSLETFPFLEVNKTLQKCDSSTFVNKKTVTESSDSEICSLKRKSEDSTRIETKHVKLTSRKPVKHDKLNNVESNNCSSPIDVSKTKPGRKIRRLVRRVSSRCSEKELVQIVQADTTMCTSTEEKGTIQSDCPLANSGDVIDSQLNNQERESTILSSPNTVCNNNNLAKAVEVAEDVSTPKELTIKENPSKTKVLPRITEELVLLDENINVILREKVDDSTNAWRKTSSEERMSAKRKETDSMFKKPQRQYCDEPLNSLSVKQPIIQSTNDNTQSQKGGNIIDKPQTNINSSMLEVDKRTEQRPPTPLNIQAPKHDRENVFGNTINALDKTEKIMVGSLTAENLQKQGKKVNCHTIVRNFIEQTVDTPSPNSATDDSKIFTKTKKAENAEKSLSAKSENVKLSGELVVVSCNEMKSDKDRTKQNSETHEFKKPTDIRITPKATDEQNKIKAVELRSFPKLKRSWKKLDSEAKKTDNSDVKDTALKKQHSQILVGGRTQSVKIPIKSNVPEYITLRDEKLSTPLVDVSGENRKHLNTSQANLEESQISVPESDYDDCISLFADSLCFSDDDLDETIHHKNNTTKELGKSIWSNDVQCNIVGSSNFDAYVKKNLDDFDKEFHNVEKEPDLRLVLLNKKQSVNKVEHIPSEEQTPLVFKTGTDVAKNTIDSNTARLFPLFRGYCFGYLMGKCFLRYCRFLHSLPPCVNYLYSQNQQNFWDMLNLAVDKKWRFFVTALCLNSLPAMRGPDIFRVFETLYNACYLTSNVVVQIVTALQNKKIPIYRILRQLKFIRTDDVKLRQHIVRLVENKICSGQFWETVKPLIPYIKSDAYFVERILHECIQNEQNYVQIQDIHKNLMSCLHVEELSLINPDLLMTFYRLVKRNNMEQNIQEDNETSTIANANEEKNAGRNVKHNVEQNVEQNAEQNMEQNIEQNVEQNAEATIRTELTISESSKSVKSTSSTSSLPNDNAHRTRRNFVTSLPIKGDQTRNIKRCADIRDRGSNIKLAHSAQSALPFKLQRTDELPPLQSMSRGTFSKLYEDFNGLKMGLEDRNYDYVVDILNTAANSDNISFYTDSCYQILRGEIMHSEEHLRNIIKCTVSRKMYSILHDILQGVAMRIIIDLADAEAWVLAYRLLKLAEKYILQFDAAFVLLSAEIYLANRRALEALGLLRHHNLIYTNRSMWRVQNSATNDHHRVEVMNILLETLSRESPMYASSLFQFLCADQSKNNHNPIDLTRHVDRIMSMLLLRGTDESIVSMARVILQFSVPLRPLTFRATVVTLVHRDDVLARQMYQYATRLGVYTTAQFSDVINFTVNMTWTEEEMYLAMSELIDRLSKDVGPAIEHLKPSNIRIFLNMETIPTDKELCSDEDKGQFYSNLNRHGCTMLQHVLARRFDPPLRVTKKGKYCRIITRAITDYLKANYCN